MFLVVLSIGMVWAQQIQTLERRLMHAAKFDVEVSGVISSMDSGVPTRVPHVTLEFRALDSLQPQETLSDDTNNLGEYKVFLRSNHEYLLDVSAKGFCSVHRPAFRANPNASLRFDFILTTHCEQHVMKGDFDDPDIFFSSRVPSYFEQRLQLGPCLNESWMIAFGKRERENDIVRYSSLPVPGHAGVFLPVTFSLGVHTVRADRAALSQKNRILRMEGNVQILDGSPSPPQSASCVTVRLGDLKPQFLPCQP